ncbi:MAG: hypothetical protein Q7R67_00465 [bacterium]|nr:hypothetical protein [bacterium]
MRTAVIILALLVVMNPGLASAVTPTITYSGPASGTHAATAGTLNFTTPGTYTITVNAKLSIVVKGVAGGGGGGGGRYDSSTGWGGAGGGGGATNLNGVTVTLETGTTYTAVVGAAGVGGSSFGSVGSAGGSTTFQISGGTVYLSLGGGGGGQAPVESYDHSVGGTGGSANVGSGGVKGGDGGNGAAPSHNPGKKGSAAGNGTGGGGGAGHGDDTGNNSSGAAGGDGLSETGGAGGAGWYYEYDNDENASLVPGAAGVSRTAIGGNGSQRAGGGGAGGGVSLAGGNRGAGGGGGGGSNFGYAGSAGAGAQGALTIGDIQVIPSTGTLTPASSSCVIAAGASSCNINFSWTTTNPIDTSVITKPTNVTVATGNSGTNVPFAIKWGGETFYLYNNGVLLDQETISGSSVTCAVGTAWNGSSCATLVYTLTVSKTGAGSGTVTSSPAGVSCGSDCSEVYNYNTAVTLTPSPSSGSGFSGWSGACSGSGGCTVTMDAAKSVTANFVTTTYTVTASVNSGSGTISGPGISCPGDCSETYSSNIGWITLIATPASGYEFDKWLPGSGTICGGQSATCSALIDGDKTARVNFSVAPPPFNYSLSNSGNSNVTKTNSNAFTQNTITKTLLTGTTEPITLSVSGVPSGTSYSIAPSSCSPACTSVITFTVSPSTPLGTYLITVTGSPLSKQTSFNLIVSGSPITVSCVASPSTAFVGESVTWTATFSGGTAPFTYSWSGTNIPTSPAPSSNPYNRTYSTIGQKTAVVTITDTDSIQSSCPAATAQINFDPQFEEF